MESVQGIIDGLKSATYEISALLLPGVVLLGVAHALVGTPDPGSILVWLVGSYAIGLALQGIASRAVRTRGIRWILGGVDPAAAPPTPAKTLATTIVTNELGAEIARRHLLDVALTRVHPNRHVYDKFLALADTARALALVAVISVGLVLYGMRDDLGSRTPWLALAGLVVAWLGLCERHRKFAPLAVTALYGKFVTIHSASKHVAASAAPPTVRGEESS